MAGARKEDNKYFEWVKSKIAIKIEKKTFYIQISLKESDCQVKADPFFYISINLITLNTSINCKLLELSKSFERQ